jgi:hypothetical protein
MQNTLRSILIFATAAAAAQTAENQTVVREQWNVIPSIYGDVRRGMVDVPPAMPPNYFLTSFRLDYEHSQQFRESSASSDDREGSEDLIAAKWRQTWMRSGWVTSEITVNVNHKEFEDQYRPGEFETLLVVPLYRTRYNCLSIAAGTTIGLLDSEDLDNSHTDQFGLGYRAQLRGVVGLGRFSLQGYVGGHYVNDGETDVQRERVDVNGTVLEEGEFDHRYARFESAIGLSYRATTWWRPGLEQTFKSEKWTGTGSDDNIDLQVLTGVSRLFMEFTPAANLNIILHAGVDLVGGRRTDVLNDALVIGAATSIAF